MDLNKEDDDTLGEVESLMKMIKGKKKDTPQRSPVAEKSSPRAGATESGNGDFSALIKELSMANKPGPIPAPVRPDPDSPSPSKIPPDPLESLFFDSDDQTEPLSEPVLTPAEPSWPIINKDGRETRKAPERMHAR